MLDNEYLVSYGRSGDFGRFSVGSLTDFSRGDRVIIQLTDGRDVGTILCPVSEGHTQFLARTAVGRILRRCAADDEQLLESLQERGQRIFDHARRLVEELKLPLEVVDVELPLEGKQAIIHHLRNVDCDYRELVSTLARTYDLLVTMQNLALPAEVEEDHGCGKPDCGHGAGGCSTCSTGGGCSTCNQGAKKEEVGAYLAVLRQRIDERERVSLL